MKTLKHLAVVILFTSFGLSATSSFAATPPASNDNAPRTAGAANDNLNGTIRAANDNGGGRTIVLARAKNAETGEVIEVSQPQSEMSALLNSSPSELDKDSKAYRDQIAEQCAATPKQNIVKNVIHEFPTEAAAFYSGVAMSAAMQAHGDPAALQHFYDNNIYTVTGHISFGFFMVGSRLTATALNGMGVGFDPCRAIRLGKSLKPTWVQKAFGETVGPLSMAGGFFVSTVATELLMDRNLQLCAYGKITDPVPGSGSPDQASNPNAETIKAHQDACNEAYKDWVLNRKIVNYTPELLSMLGTSVIQTYIINKPASWGKRSAKSGLRFLERKGTAAATLAADAEGKITRSLVLRGISIAANFTPGFFFKLAIQAGQAAVFMTINPLWHPYISAPWQTWMQGSDITHDINEVYAELDRAEKNGWVWTPKPLPPECSYDPSVLELGEGYMKPSYCYRDPQKVSTLVDQLNDRYAHWRQTGLSEAIAANGSWKDYLSKFETSYANSHMFYTTLLNIMGYKNNPKNAPSLLATQMYDSVATNGIDGAFYTDICKIDSNQKQLFKVAAEYANEALEQLKSRLMPVVEADEIANLGKVAEGLNAIDCSQSTYSITALRSSLSMVSASPNNDYVERSVIALRGKLAREAFATINQILNGNSRLATFSRTDATRVKIPESRNPFLAIFNMIGDTRPQPAGTTFLAALDKEDSIISQATKDDHPLMFYNVETSSMSNYLLASMVCGPKVGQDEAVTTKQLAGHKQSLIGKFLGLMSFGFDLDLTNRMSDSKSMIEVSYDEAGSKDARGMIGGIFGIRASFHPPRIIKLPGKEDSRNLCQEAGVSDLGYQRRVADPRDVEFVIDGQTVKGLLEVVKRYADPALVSDNTSIFESYWKDMVDKHVLKVIGLYRNDFKHLAQEKYFPQFTSSEHEDYNGRRFEKGTIKSIKDQMHLNLIILGKSLFPTITQKSPAAEVAMRDKFSTLSAELERRMGLQLQLLSGDDNIPSAINGIETYAFESDKSKIPDSKLPLRQQMHKVYDANQNSILALLKTIQEVPSLQSKANPAAVQTLKDLDDASVRAIKALVTETSSYYGIVDTVHLEGIR